MILPPASTPIRGRSLDRSSLSVGSLRATSRLSRVRAARVIQHLLVLAVLATAARAATSEISPAPAASEPIELGGPVPESHRLDFMIPKAFQRNPRLELTAITEFTEAGRQRPEVTPEAPATYAAHALGFRTQGEAIKITPLAAEDVETLLVRALAKNGFVRAAEGQQPDLAIVYVWGAHNRFDLDLETSAVSLDVLMRNVLDRAAMVGGSKFAAELAQAYRNTELVSAASPKGLEALPEHLQGASVGIALGMAQMNAMMNPVRLFAMRSEKNQRLLDQVADDCYFVVASAYDYSSIAENKPVLLWRTRLTVNARGVSQKQSLPPLIAAAAPYFGRDMPEAAILRTRPVRAGEVEIGVSVVVP